MALRDRIRSLAAPEPAPPTRAKGASGRQHTGGFIQPDETNPKLQGRNGIRLLEDMWRSDADARRALTLVVASILGGTWDVEPYGSDDDSTTDEDRQVAQFVTWALCEHMRPKLPGHLWQALTVAGRAGFAPFEQVYELADWDGRQVWALRTLDLRRPQTVDRFNQDGPDLVSIEQFVPGAGLPSATIPAKDLVYYRFGAEGDNWEGQSLLRAAYKHWRYKDGIELVQAIGIEKFAVGIPLVYPPQDASADDLEAAEDAVEGIRANESAYIVAPGPKQQGTDSANGWLFEILTPNGSGSTGTSQDIIGALNHHADKIASTVIAEFMRQGMGTVGTNATAQTQQNPFLAFVEAVCTIVAEAPINEQLIPRLVGLNFQTDRMPRLRASLVDSTSIAELGDYVQKLSAAGALRPEPTLEAYLRDRAGLPAADEAAIEQQQAQEAEQAQAEADRAHAQAVEIATAKGTQQLSLDTEPRTLARQDRPLRGFEAHMTLDRIESTIDSAREQMAAGCAMQARALAVTLAAQAQKGRRIRPADGPTDLTDAVQAQLEALYEAGRVSVRDELTNQALAPFAVPSTLAASDLAQRLRERAQHISDAVRAAVVQALGRVGISRDPEHADLQAAAELAATAALRTQAQDHAAAVLNAGRTDQADELSDQIAGSYYTAILDGRACSACRSADDDVLRPLNDPVRLARIPPNVDCQGGARCRCLEAFVLDTEAPAGA